MSPKRVQTLLKRVSEIDESAAEELQNFLDRANSLSRQRTRELEALMAGAKAVLSPLGFTETARAIFDHCRQLIGATSGYVALLSPDGAENEVLFLESGGLPCTVDPELPMPIRGLRHEAYRECKAVYHNDFMHSEWVGFMPSGHVVLHNVLFAPLIINEKTVGVMGLANKPSDFDAQDAKMAEGFGELAAIALSNSQQTDRRNMAEKARETVIDQLQDALERVQTLSGLLPICSHCKKIRDDKGYWNQIDHYISQHSKAEFSHSICPGCAKIHYPDMDIYSDDDL
ncbi:MAG: GAF domain-containing protein [Desulfatibacillum sp.]|nr:GAF domain-containing protein [Desulfatibacillum sp.]